MDQRKLFQPMRLNSMQLKNRFVGLPVGLSGYTDGSDSPTERMVALYRRRALGGSALVTVEIAYVEPPPYAISRRGLLGFYSDRQINRFAVLTDAIHQGGARAAIQFTDRWHADFPYEMEDLTVAQIEAMIDHYVRAAVRARAAGFDMAEFEVAHGWPLERFASPLTNHRHDKYGDFSYVPSEVVRRARAAVGNDFTLSARLSIIEDMDSNEGITLEQSIQELCPALEGAGADVLSLTFGLGPIARKVKDYKATETIYSEPGDKFEYTKAVRERLAIPVISRSRVNDPHLAERAVEDGSVDLVGLGRQLLADPDFPAKTQERRYDDINRCIACDFCQGVTVTQGRTLHCTVNGSLGRELEAALPMVQIRRPKSVLVVGGGPAGMEAALRLAGQGCDVTLVERSEHLGGLVRLVSHLPHLRLLDLEYSVDYLARRLEESPVKVQMGTEFSPGLAEKLGAEVIVLATGSAPREASLPGTKGRSNGVTVRSFFEYLAGEPIGKRVVVDGQDEGVEFAVSLARAGHQVTLVESKTRLAPTIYDYSLRRHQALEDYLIEDGIAAHWSSRVAGLERGAVLVERHNGVAKAVPADTLLLAGRTALRPDVATLPDRVQAVYEIGDCRQPRGIAEALDEARALANTIAG